MVVGKNGNGKTNGHVNVNGNGKTNGNGNGAGNGNGKINDLIFKELIKRGYSLAGNTRIWNIADSKLWYLTPEQSQAYLDLDSDEVYKKDTGQFQAKNLIKDNIREIVQKLGDEPLNIIDLGCGDGSKSAIIFQEIKKLKPNLQLRYCPIDISGYMVEKAIDNFSKLDVEEVIEFQYNISDFENLGNITPLLRKAGFKKNLILLLGNTLGNFEINELLYEIKSSMNDDDLFLVDIAVDDKKQEERAESYMKNPGVNNWLVHIPLQLGLNKEDIEFGMRFRNSRMEAYYTINKNKEVKFQDKSVHFNRGDQLVVAVAYKYGEDDLREFLHIHFDDALVKISEDHSKAFALCKK